MKPKKIITMLLAVVMLLGMLPLSAFASEWGEGDTLEEALAEFKVGYHDNWLDWLTLPGLGVINQRYSYFLFVNERTGTIDEHPVYCIDPTKGGAYEVVQNIGPNDDGSNTATYIRSERAGDTRYLAILASGFPHNRHTSLGLQSDEEGYYATKVALWMYIRGNDATKLAINPKYGDSDPVALRVYNAAIKIYNNSPCKLASRRFAIWIWCCRQSIHPFMPRVAYGNIASTFIVSVPSSLYQLSTISGSGVLGTTL